MYNVRRNAKQLPDSLNRIALPGATSTLSNPSRARRALLPSKLTAAKVIILGVAALIAVYGFSGGGARAFTDGPPESHTGAPGEQNCTVCHASFPVDSGPGAVTITGLPATYTPNQQVPVTLTVSQPDRLAYGFQVTALDDSGRQAGTLVATDSVNTQLVTGFVEGILRRYIQHTRTGVIPFEKGQRRWTFMWMAPSAPVGRVTFYAAGNAANGDGSQFEDYIYTRSVSTVPAAPEPIQVVLSRDGGGNLRATVTITNPLPNPVPGVMVTLVRASTLDGSAFVDGVPVPQSFGTVNPGQSVTAVVTFPGTSGVPPGFNGLVRVDLSYTGGTYSETKQVTTP